MFHVLGDGLYFKLKREFWERINYARTDAGDYWNDLARKLGFSIDYMKEVRPTKKYPKSQESVSLKLLMKLLAYARNNRVEIDLENEKLIYALRCGRSGKWIRNPRIPFNFLDRTWAGILGACITDGHLQPDGKMYFISADFRLANEVIKLVKDAVGDMDVEPSVRVRGDNMWYVTIFPKVVGRILINSFGMTPGNKVRKNVRLPIFVENLNVSQHQHRYFLSEFLKWVFSCDGWVNRGNSTIGICFNRDVTDLPTHYLKDASYAPQLLIGTKDALTKLGIKTSKPYFMGAKMRKNGRLTTKWRIEIQNKKGLVEFANSIGFVVEEKWEKLKCILNSTNGFNLLRRT